MIGPELDLHTFKPAECEALVEEYVRECQANDLLEVRIVHGKGTGQLRARVHSVLARLPEVTWFGLDGANWGATVVRIAAQQKRC
jgi:DNA-nicking Smr family endonuclease